MNYDKVNKDKAREFEWQNQAETTSENINIQNGIPKEILTIIDNVIFKIATCYITFTFSVLNIAEL